MAQLRYVDGRFVLVTSYDEREVAKFAGGRWDPEARVWILPRRFGPEESQMLAAALVRYEVHGSAQTELDAISARKAALQQAAASYHAGGVGSSIALPNGARLLPHQETGVAFLVERERAILADEPGLGKTVQAIAAAEQAGASRALIIAPKSLLLQWQREIERFARQPSRFTVTNYETIPATETDEDGRKRVRVKPRWRGFDCLIVDECVRIKNRDAQRTQAIWQLAKAARWVWLLTGTPIRNRPHDLWAMLHALDPQEFSSFWRFVTLYCQMWSDGFGSRIGGLRPDRADDFHRLILPWVLRREKSLLKLPPLSEETVYLGLDPRAERAYVEMERYMVARRDGRTLLVASNPLTQVLRLRQLATDPELVGVRGTSTKTEWLLEWLEDNAADHKAVVFCDFRQYIERIAEDKRFAKYGPVIVTGQRSGAQRDAAVQALNRDDGCRVLLTTTAGGEGLNLQEAADTVIYVNKPMTPDLVQQIRDRVYRQGQTRPVHCYSLVCAGTVDQDIEELLQSKREIATEALALQEVVKAILARAA